MKYKLRKHLNDDTAYYDKDAVDKYADYLEEKGRLFEVGNLLFDVEAMQIPFVCDTRLCMPEGDERKKGCGRGKKAECTSCCVSYAPRISTDERDRIDSILGAVRDRFPSLGGEIDKKDGYYYWDENYDRFVHKKKKEYCVFLTPDKKEFGFHACMLHAYALEKKLPTALYKPSACTMFPIFILELSEGDRILVTAHTKEVRNVGEEVDEYHEVTCIERNYLATKPLYQEMKETLSYMFGAGVWKKLEGEMKRRSKQ